MEILAHTLWTTTGVRKINATSKKKGGSFNISMIWAAFWGIFPDLFAFTIPFIISFYKVLIGEQQFGSFSTRHQIADGFNLSHTLYQYSHSLVIFVLVFLLIWVIVKRPPWVLLAWAFHIIFDIPSHPITFFPTPFLFPISDYYFPYGIGWRTPWFMAVNYAAILVVWGGFLIKKYRKKKNT